MDKIEAIAIACQKKEGWFPGSVSQRCNNPGNILHGALSIELGSTDLYKSPNGLTYAVFPDYATGFTALKRFLMLGFSGKLKHYKPEMTLKEFFRIYSGGGETYGQFVADHTGIPVETQVRYIYDQFWNDKQIESESSIKTEKIENQDQEKYDHLYLGKSKSCMRYYGCKLFSVTAMYNIIFGKNITPEEMNNILTEGGAYFGKNGDLLDDSTIAKILGILYIGKETDINEMPEWSPTIKEVDFSPKVGKQQHFVLRIVRENGMRSIIDPWGGVERIVNYYEKITNNPYWSKGGFSYRLFKKKD